MIQVITEELGMNLEKFEPQMLGTCKKVWMIPRRLVDKLWLSLERNLFEVYLLSANI